MNKKAVTLIELVLVVILVGVLVAFGAPRYENVLIEARQKDSRVNLALVKSAQEIYFAEIGAYYPDGGGNVDDVGTINLNLNTLLIEDSIDYICSDTGTSTTSRCEAAPTVGTANWTYSITQADSEPQCSGARCP